MVSAQEYDLNDIFTDHGWKGFVTLIVGLNVIFMQIYIYLSDIDLFIFCSNLWAMFFW